MTDAALPEKLLVSSSPHLKHPDTTRTVMHDVAIALLPALLLACYRFGLRTLTLTLISVAACTGLEWLWQRLRHLSSTVADGSALVTGMLIAMNLPVSAPLWLPLPAAVFAIVLVKQLFGGIGKNVVNPALAARVFLFLSFPSLMTRYTAPVSHFLQDGLSPFALSVSTDGITCATPLADLARGSVPTCGVTPWGAFLGDKGGMMGEISALFLLLGGVYLLLRRVITWHIPVSYLGTVALLTLLFPRVADMTALQCCVMELCSGGLMLAALFMATDYVTSPLTARGRLLYGFGCGILTVFLRYFGAAGEGCSFAVLVMNLLVHPIDRLTMPTPFGGKPNAKT